MTDSKSAGKIPAHFGRQPGRPLPEKRRNTQFRRQEDIAVRESEKRFREIFDHAPIGMVLTDLEGRFLYVNAAYCHITGFTREELLKGDLLGIIHPDDIGRTQAEIDRLLAGETASSFLEKQIIRRDGRALWVRVSMTLRRNDDGTPYQLVCLVDDISARKKAEQALRESEERFRQAADAAKLGAYSRNFETGESFFSPEFKKIYGFDPEEPFPLQDGIPANVHPEDRQRVLEEAAARLTRADGQFSTEHRIIHNHDRSTRWVMVRGRFEMNSLTSRPLRSYGFAMDITDRKEAEEALRQSRDEMEQRVQERTAELENRARQLVRLTAELTTAEQRERRRLAETLHDHLQQLLVAARMQVEQLKGEQTAAAICPSLNTIHDTLNEAIASTRSLTRDLSPPVLYRGGLPAALNWLAGEMKQKQQLNIQVQTDARVGELPEALNVLLFTTARELLFNVAKHAGTLEACVRLYRRDNVVRLEVSDEGKGFDVANIDYGDTATGFGLFSVRERIDYLGGELHMESAPDRGSRFVVSVPVGEDTHCTAVPVADVSLPPHTKSLTAGTALGSQKNIRVLLVDDHRVMREGLVSLLDGKDGIEVVGQADNGRHAIELVEQLKPDAVTMDVSMPVMDGIQATRLIKQKWPKVRVIGLSMFEEKELAEKMYGVGADMFLSKTGPSGQLVKAIRNEL